jgi:phage tail-like protein
MIVARPVGVTYPRLGTFRTSALDSGIFNCVWHRLVLAADIPETTNLTVRTFTAAAPLDDERIAALPEGRWSRPITINPGARPELLLQSPAGRYLWLDIAFGGNGSRTPVVDALELYAPRRSSLHFLPPVFHEDPVSADFVDRYLSYFDTIFDEIESRIEGFTAYLDPDGVPAGGFLTWLGGWFDLEFLAEWPEATRREFVRRAIELHRTRGTVAGLRTVLQLHTGLDAKHINIIEHFRLRAQTDPLYIAGRLLQPPANEMTHHFTVVLPYQAAPDEAAVTTLDRLINRFKPAHTRHALRLVEPGVRIGCQSTIGLDMIIGRPEAAPLGAMRLGQSGQLAATSPLPRVGHVFLR